MEQTHCAVHKEVDIWINYVQIHRYKGMGIGTGTGAWGQGLGHGIRDMGTGTERWGTVDGTGRLYQWSSNSMALNLIVAGITGITSTLLPAVAGHGGPQPSVITKPCVPQTFQGMQGRDSSKEFPLGGPGSPLFIQCMYVYCAFLQTWTLIMQSKYVHIYIYILKIIILRSDQTLAAGRLKRLSSGYN